MDGSGAGFMGIPTEYLQQFQLPEEERKRILISQLLLGMGAGIGGARRGNEIGGLSQGAAAGGLAARQSIDDAMKNRTLQIGQAANVYKLAKDQQLTDMGMRLMQGGEQTIPEQAGPAAPNGAPATYIPPGTPTTYGNGGYQTPGASAELGLAFMGKKDAADVVHRQKQLTFGPNGEIQRDGQFIGRTTPAGTVWYDGTPGGRWDPITSDALKAIASQSGAVKGAETAATEAAQQPYRTVKGPYGPNNLEITKYVNDAPGLGQPNVGGQQGDPLVSVMPRNEQEAAALTQILGSRGIGARYVQQNGQFVAGNGHGAPINQAPGGLTDPLAVEAAKGKVSAQTSQDTEIAKSQGQDYVGILNAEKQAPGNIGKYQLLKQHLSNVETGKLAPTVQSLKAYAAYVAPDLAKEWTKDVPYAQAASALANEMALQLRNPNGGAGMPGSLSNSDRDFLVSMTTSAANDPRAIPLMLDAKIALEKRNQEVGKLARDYRKANGAIDDGFYEALAQYSEAHPLFPQAQQQAQGQAPHGISPQEAAAELRRRNVKGY